jgi:NAD(P)-dependent dehydrogenase (short-subunit alcohol dehydrogenase family)
VKPALLITGASRGIGAATAVLAAQQGWAVAVNYASNAQAARDVVTHITDAGGTAIAVQADVGDEAQILRMFEQIDAQLGRLSGLVNNAGVLDTGARVDEMSWQRVERIMRINVLGSFACAREAIRRMSTRHGGHGGAIDTFTTGLAKEVAGEGIRVNGVRPGIIDTDIHASGGLPNRARDLAAQIPMQRAGSAAEVAESIVWLLSDAASYITGTTIEVTGGR